MDARLLEVLADPKSRKPLQFEGTEESGKMTSETGNSYEVRNGIPRFVEMDFEKQTAGSFKYKWQRQSAYEDDSVVNMIQDDEWPRWGLKDMEEFRDIFRGPKTILDAGCGSAHFASIYAPYVNDTNNFWVGMDLTPAIDIAKDRFKELKNAAFVQGNLLEVPFKKEAFDTILCRGVMHHTPDQWGAFRNLTSLLKPGGEFCFLIYRKMGPIREFTDTHIRREISKLPPEEGWKALEALTDFGKSLSEANVQIEVPTDIPYLEIPAGKYDLHDLMYNHFVKAFWSNDQGLKDEYLYDYSQHNTFDWYHPEYATKATKEDIEQHAAEQGLEITFIKDLYTSWAVRCRKK